LTFSSN